MKKLSVKTRIKWFIARWFLYLDISKWHRLMRPYSEQIPYALSPCQAAAWRACLRARPYVSYGYDGYGNDLPAMMEAALGEYLSDWYIGRRWFKAIMDKKYAN